MGFKFRVFMVHGVLSPRVKKTTLLQKMSNPFQSLKISINLVPFSSPNNNAQFFSIFITLRTHKCKDQSCTLNYGPNVLPQLVVVVVVVVVVLIIAQHFASASCCFVVSCLLFVVV